MISISPSCCPGDTGCSGSASSNGGSTPQTPAKVASNSGNVAAPEKGEKAVSPPIGGNDLVDGFEPCPEL